MNDNSWDNAATRHLTHPFDLIEYFPHSIKKQLTSLVRKWNKEQQVKRWRAKRKGLDRSFSNAFFVDKLVRYIKFPIPRFYSKNTWRMDKITSSHLDTVLSVLKEESIKWSVLIKEDLNLSKSLKRKWLEIDSKDFIECLEMNDTISECSFKDELWEE